MNKESVQETNDRLLHNMVLRCLFEPISEVNELLNQSNGLAAVGGGSVFYKLIFNLEKGIYHFFRTIEFDDRPSLISECWVII